MKKTVFLLVLVALLCCGMASASGIDGLIPAASTGPVPDPAQITESYGELLAENYEFSVGYFCDAYVYETPDDVRDFADMYATRCRKAGVHGAAPAQRGISEVVSGLSPHISSSI